jgi:hypothetical protein
MGWGGVAGGSGSQVALGVALLVEEVGRTEGARVLRHYECAAGCCGDPLLLQHCAVVACGTHVWRVVAL